MDADIDEGTFSSLPSLSSLEDTVLDCVDLTSDEERDRDYRRPPHPAPEPARSASPVRLTAARNRSRNGSESTREQGGGNTNPPPRRVAQPVQSKYWAWTWHCPEIANEMDCLQQMADTVVAVFDARNFKYVFQSERCPRTDRLHLQGYVEAERKFRWTELNMSQRIHWGKRRGTQLDNIIYCSRIDKRTDPGFVYVRGLQIPKPLELIDPTYPWQQQVLQQIKEKPDNRKIFWYWSDEGGVGKTCFGKYLVAKHGACLLGGRGSDVRNGIVKWKEAKGETPELCLYNITRSFDPTYVSYEALENIKDMCFYSGKYEGAQIVGNPPHLYVFANYAPPQGKLSEDRLRVWEIVGPDAIEGHCVEPAALH